MSLRIGEIFRTAARATPTRVAASLGDQQLRFDQLNALGNRLANTLAAQGIKRGERVMWWGDTALEALPLFVALAKLGAVFAPINARLGEKEAAELVRFARPAALICDASHAEATDAVGREMNLAWVGRLGAERGPGLDLSDAMSRASSDEPSDSGVGEDDPHVIFFTSGSTGRPKGVVLSHRVNHLRTFQGALLAGRSRTVCMFPLFHMAGWTLALGSWQARDSITFVNAPSAEELLSAIERERATRLYCIPAVWARILEADRSRYDLSSLRDADTGTSATPPELIEGLKAGFPGTCTRIHYGSTEGGASTTLGEEDVLRKPGSVGLPAAGVEIKLGEGGEVCVRSEYLMSEYFDNPEATHEVLREGWYHSGDVGALDEEGYLSIVGRLRDIIRSGGETVAPAEVEAALADHPAVAEIAVVGLPDQRWGELVCAVIVPRAGMQPRLEDLRQHAAARLASYKQPRRIECVAELPRTSATGQVQRALLIERIQSQPERP